MVDVGADRGALVVWVPADLEGSELELRSPGTPWLGQHTAVRPRHLRNRTCFAAVFGSLGAGRYELRQRGRPGGPVLGTVVDGGTVTEATWPDRTG